MTTAPKLLPTLDYLDRLCALIAHREVNVGPGDYLAKVLTDYATACILADRADRESAGAVANLGEYVIALLIAGGFVTQAKCDEARAIALGLADGPLSPSIPLPESALRALVEAVSKHVKLWEDGMDDDDSAISLRAALAQPELLKWLGRKS